MVARSMWIRSFLSFALMALGVVVAMGLGVVGGTQTAWAEVQAGASDELATGDSETVLTEPAESMTAWTNDYETEASCVNSYLALVEQKVEGADEQGQGETVTRL